MSGFEEPPVEINQRNEKPEKSDRWYRLDRDQEAQFEQSVQYFRGLVESGGQEGVRQQFLEAFGNGILKPEDLTSLELHFVHSEPASQVAGQPIIRPVFIIRDPEQLKKFFSAYTDKDIEGELGGVYVHRDLHNLNLAEEAKRAGLIITRNNPSSMIHEIQHSIDPQLTQREAYHNVLSEAFAYFDQWIVKRGVDSGDTGEPLSQEEAWQKYEEKLGHINYYRMYTTDISRVNANRKEDEFEMSNPLTGSARRAQPFPELTFEQWQELIHELVTVIRQRFELDGAVEVQRELGSRQTINNFIEYNQKVLREKLPGYLRPTNQSEALQLLKDNRESSY